MKKEEIRTGRKGRQHRIALGDEGVPVPVLSDRRNASAETRRTNWHKMKAPIRMNLKIDPLVNGRIEQARKQCVPPQTKQKYVTEAVLRRLSQEWKTL